MARKTRIEDDSSSSDEFPGLDQLIKGSKQTARVKGVSALQTAPGSKVATAAPTPPATVRRRKLGQLTHSTLLQPWGQDGREPPEGIDEPHSKNPEPSQGPRVKLRARKPQILVEITPKDEGDENDDEYLSAKEEITFVEEATVHESDGSSDFQQSEGSDFENDDDSDMDTFFDSQPGRIRRMEPAVQQPKRQPAASPSKRRQLDNLAATLDDLCLGEKSPSKPQKASRAKTAKTPPRTPPRTPPKTKREGGLVSPKKLPGIPATPHPPASDLFWSQEFVDDWNDQHSPRKLLFQDPGKSPAKAASPKKQEAKAKAAVREAKKSFEKAKHAIADSFLQELDATITQGELAQLAAPTGGIKLNWTNKLNTTAGRANWKRETIQTRATDGTIASVTHRHYASIEIAEKVIDDEDRLLNVLAHEFCHLANFMINGVTNNPHGKEFKAWAAKCSRAFGDRGIQVTTKHSYDIDFKYVWECTECGTAFKRHSKSINPERHRCGTCKGALAQTKPVPRSTAGKTTEYQKFMKEQMRVLKEENPKSPQKEIMKLVADKWAKEAKPQGKRTANAVAKLEDVVDGLQSLAIEAEA